MKKYEDHLRETGQEPSHALFKEMLAGAAGFEVTHNVLMLIGLWVLCFSGVLYSQQLSHDCCR